MIEEELFQEYEYAQESSQKWTETFEQYKKRISKQESVYSANRALCKYEISKTAVRDKNGKISLLYVISDINTFRIKEIINYENFNSLTLFETYAYYSKGMHIKKYRC